MNKPTAINTKTILHRTRTFSTKGKLVQTKASLPLFVQYNSGRTQCNS